MSKQEIENLRFGANMSKGVYHFKKSDEEQPFEALLEEFNFWECFQGHELKIITMFRDLKYQWGFLTEVIDLVIEKDDFKSQFLSAAMIEKYGEKEVITAVLDNKGRFILYDLNGNVIYKTEADKIDSVTKRSVF